MSNCPFCNSEPEIQEKTRYLKRKIESSAKNIELVKVNRNARGNILYHLYKQTYYIIRCSNKKCIAYHFNKSFWSHEDALNEWNKRREIETNHEL